jgi:hypothetical protein
MGKHNDPLTLKDALLQRLNSYAAEVESGRHVPPPSPTAALLRTSPAVALVSHR